MMSLSRCHSELFATLRGGNRAEEPHRHLAMKWQRRNTRACTHTCLSSSLQCVYLLFDSRGQLCGRWWMSFQCCSTDKQTKTLPPSVLSPIIPLTEEHDRKRQHSTLDALTDLFIWCYSMFELQLLSWLFWHRYMCNLNLINCYFMYSIRHSLPDKFEWIRSTIRLHAYCSGSAGWRVAPPHGSAGPAGSPRWLGGRPAASSAAPCTSDAGPRPEMTGQPESGTDLTAEPRFLTALTAACRWRQSDWKLKS